MGSIANNSINTIQILITGKVQGVYFRQNTREKALNLGISGTVKNINKNKVQVVASGSREQLQQLIDWCAHGPANATVTDIEIKELAPESFTGFTIER